MEIKKLSKEYWPEGLFEIPQPPEQLWTLGEFPDLDGMTLLCVVGSRKFTTYGKEVCEKLIEGLKGHPVVIVSGLAMGIDAIAHQTALNVGLKALVFPGSGLSRKALYPKTNFRLAEDILKNGGCLVSEFDPDFLATLWGFPKRNRIMAGISKAVLVIEASEKSGTAITARLATEYNRDVLVVPGPIFAPNSKGTNRLLRQGATPITCVDDLLEALDLQKDPSAETQQKLFAELSPQELKIIDALREPMPRDELIRTLGMNTSEANSLLTVMEIKKLIKEEMGEIRLR